MDEDAGGKDVEPGGREPAQGAPEKLGSHERRSPLFRFAKRLQHGWTQFASMYLNFFRVHLAYFILVPLVVSAILYGSSPKSHHVPYIDCLFISVSAMTVTGLVTVPISQLTVWQQVILFLQIIFGNLIFVSWIMVLVRRHIFRSKFRQVVREDIRVRRRMLDVEANERQERDEENRRMKRWFGWGHHEDKAWKKPKLHAHMVHRTDVPAVLVNPTGHQTQTVDNPSELLHTNYAEQGQVQGILQSGEDTSQQNQHTVRISEPTAAAQLETPGVSPPETPAESRPELPAGDAPAPPSDSLRGARRAARLPRSQTIALSGLSVPEPRPPGSSPLRKATTIGAPERHGPMPRFGNGKGLESDEEEEEEEEEDEQEEPALARARRLQRAHPLQRTMTMTKTRGLGGFPSVFDYATSLVEQVYPKLHERVTGAGGMQRTRSVRLESTKSTEPRAPTQDDRRLAPYLTFDATVAGNSHFFNLTAAQRRELGGVEYRALDLLAWLIPTYWLTLVLLAIVITLPYLCSAGGAKYRAELKNQDKPVGAAWFWIFNVVSGISNTGMSLYDNSLQGPVFNHGWMFVIPVGTLILLGNTGFPVALRFVVWVMSRVMPKNTRTYETLHFLLDHPRRCFVYMFPSQQTWFLFWLVFALTMIDWLFIMLLDIGVSRTMPHDMWVADGLFQAVSTRAAGFQTFDVQNLSPAEQVLEVVMMYVAAFPIALTVRSTNVYEERCLGIYDEGDEDTNFPTRSGWNLWGRFISTHARRQLAYDLWWLSLGLWLVCIVEKDHIQDRKTDDYFAVWYIVYELTSAYGTVGLSTGSPSGVSLSGSFHPLSKLIVCAVMIRGRHRGLPYAIDRAVLLPDELRDHDMWHDASMEHALPPSTDPVGSGADEAHTTAVSPSAVHGGHELRRTRTGSSRHTASGAQDSGDWAPANDTSAHEPSPMPERTVRIAEPAPPHDADAQSI